MSRLEKNWEKVEYLGNQSTDFNKNFTKIILFFYHLTPVTDDFEILGKVNIYKMASFWSMLLPKYTAVR